MRHKKELRLRKENAWLLPTFSATLVFVLMSQFDPLSPSLIFTSCLPDHLASLLHTLLFSPHCIVSIFVAVRG